jgi:hypothetical protein
MPLDVLLLAGVAVLIGLIVYLVAKGRRQRVDPEDSNSGRRSREEVDTVAAWPPEVTRLLTSGERSANEVLGKALPECLIFAQVPLARFIKVPRRHSYAEWLTRVGHLCADFVICDRASLVIGAVLLQTMRDSERAGRRRARMARVLKAAGVKVFIWREEALPNAETAREQIIQRTGVPSTTPASDTAPLRGPRPVSVGANGIPLPEVVTVSADDGPRLEPPPSTWFDDLDSGRVPLEQEPRKQGDQGR